MLAWKGGSNYVTTNEDQDKIVNSFVQIYYVQNYLQKEWSELDDVCIFLLGQKKKLVCQERRNLQMKP